MEIKVCKKCNQNFQITPDDFLFYEKMQVPAPTHCPKCRQIRRLFVRNFRTLYRRPSSKSGKAIISMYHERQPFPVWSTEEWYADDWDATSYGRDFDFARPFFEQYKELNDQVPRFSLMVNNSTDCGFSNLCNRSARCYFVFGCVDNEDCDYSHSVWNCRESVDCLYLFKSEYCYQCIDVLESTRLLYCRECEACTDSIALFDCRGCVNCIGCVGLRNKSYHIFNKQVTKEEYQKFLSEYPLSDPKVLQHILSQRDALMQEVPTPHMFGSHNVAASGNHVYHAKNVHWAFDVKSGEDSKFGFTVRKFINSYDCGFSLDIENSYECLFSQPYGLKFCHLAIDCTDTTYSEACFNSNNLFGCVGLRKKDYCILNKQYTKEEYEIMVPKIIEHMKQNGEWGEYFPIAISPYAYNESTVGEYYPLTKDQALAFGYRWEDNIPDTKGQENCLLDSLLPAQIYNWEFLKDKIFACQACKRNYRFINHEISFYERFRLALPTKCFFCRHDERMAVRLPRLLYHRKCMCNKTNHAHVGNCSNEFDTAYAPDRLEKVYCEKCYQQEMV